MSDEPRAIKTLGIGKRVTNHLQLKVSMADHPEFFATHDTTQYIQEFARGEQLLNPKVRKRRGVKTPREKRGLKATTRRA